MKHLSINEIVTNKYLDILLRNVEHYRNQFCLGIIFIELRNAISIQHKKYLTLKILTITLNFLHSMEIYKVFPNYMNIIYWLILNVSIVHSSFRLYNTIFKQNMNFDYDCIHFHHSWLTLDICHMKLNILSMLDLLY